LEYLVPVAAELRGITIKINNYVIDIIDSNKNYAEYPITS